MKNRLGKKEKNNNDKHKYWINFLFVNFILKFMKSLKV